MSSLQSVAPILGSALYAGIYNSSTDLPYPWKSSYLFNSVGFISIGNFYLIQLKATYYFMYIGCFLTLYVYISNGFKQIEPDENEDSCIDVQLF